MIRVLPLLIAMHLLGGCAMFSCAGWDKGQPSRKDTEGTKAWILKHNNFGRAQGCWK